MTGKIVSGCSYNATVEWEDGSIPHEPLNIFGPDAPELCAEYGQKHDLLNVPRWEHFHHITNSKKILLQMINAAKLKSFHNTVQYMYGVGIPCYTKNVL